MFLASVFTDSPEMTAAILAAGCFILRIVIVFGINRCEVEPFLSVFDEVLILGWGTVEEMTLETDVVNADLYRVDDSAGDWSVQGYRSSEMV